MKRYIKNKMIIPLLLGVMLLAMAGCGKDDDEAAPQETDGSSIKFVLNDNFNFAVLYMALDVAKLTDTLAHTGPFTFLAPDNGAFLLASIREPVVPLSFQFYRQSQLVQMMQYSILRDKIAFRSLPLTANQPLLTAAGGNVYLSRFMQGADTVTTINGFKLTSVDNSASNGYIQVLPQLLNAERYSKAMDYMRNDTTLSLFVAALHRSGLDASLLSGTDVYTLLAPSNTAFQRSVKYGMDMDITTLDGILHADPVKLAAFLEYHIIKGRQFEGDLYRYVATHPEGITMLDEHKVKIGGNPAGFHAMTFAGGGNNGDVALIAVAGEYNPTLNNANIPCGNAVVHIIDKVLIP